ncbi:hypothetical protein [Phaeobacter phage MD18]|nr:hypothetical protein [Phaeobacter phage MD18]
MARFTKYFPTPLALNRNALNPSTVGAAFIGWDSPEADVNGMQNLATEATRARDVGKPMSATDAAHFHKLLPGQRLTVNGYVYAYD